jgi:Peptidase family M28
MSLKYWCLPAVVVFGAVLVAAEARHEEAFAVAVDEAALRRSVRELVAFGPRMGGTPSNERSAEFLAGYFRNLGLAVTVVDDPATLAHWEDRWRVELEDGGALESAWPYGFSPSTVPVTGRVIAVDDLNSSRATAEWKGAIVYTPMTVTVSAYLAIAKSAAVPSAILTSAPNNPERYVDWSRIGSLPERRDNPIPVFAVSYMDGRTLAAAARAGRRVRVSLTSHVREGRPKTVVASIAGREPDKYFLICAHGDSDAGGPGADDNASGVATVLEIARVYSTLIRNGTLPKPRYTLRFAIWGMEYHSAKAFIEREGARLSGAQAVINFDETGTGAERDAIYFEPNEVPWNERLMRTFESVAGDYAGKPGFWSEYTSNPSQGGTDSYAFLPRQFKGTGYTSLQIPSTTVYTAAWDDLRSLKQTPGWESKGTPDAVDLKIDYSLYYHSSGDTPDNTTEREPFNMVRAVKLTGIALVRLNQ